MTVIAWVGLIAVAALCIIIAKYIIDEFFLGKLGVIITVIISAACVLGTGVGLHWYFSSTERGSRALKTQQSELGGGLNRTVTVYSYDGKILGKWTGKFDVTEDDQETYFDVKDKRVIIQGGIIINEEN